MWKAWVLFTVQVLFFLSQPGSASADDALKTAFRACLKYRYESKDPTETGTSLSYYSEKSLPAGYVVLRCRNDVARNLFHVLGNAGGIEEEFQRRVGGGMLTIRRLEPQGEGNELRSRCIREEARAGTGQLISNHDCVIVIDANPALAEIAGETKTSNPGKTSVRLMKGFNACLKGDKPEDAGKFAVYRHSSEGAPNQVLWICEGKSAKALFDGLRGISWEQTQTGPPTVNSRLFGEFKWAVSQCNQTTVDSDGKKVEEYKCSVNLRIAEALATRLE